MKSEFGERKRKLDIWVWRKEKRSGAQDLEKRNINGRSEL